MSDPIRTGGRFIGERVHRREDPRLLTGRGRFVDDLTVPSMLHATFVRSTVARGSIVVCDLEASRALPGVHAVLTLVELDTVRDIDAMFDLGIGPPTPIAAPLAGDSVNYVGDPIAIVIADDRAIAEDACGLAVIDYEEQEPCLDLSDADPAAMLPPVDIPASESRAAFDAATHVVTSTIVQNRYLPVPMEPRAILADWDPIARTLTVWNSTQGPHRVREHLASVLGVTQHRVRVIVGDVGGAFGLKLFVSREETATVLASRYLGRPIKWIEDRWENLIAGGQARAEQAEVSIALDDQARILGFHAEHLVDVGAHGPANFGLARMIAGPYRVQAVSGRTTSVRTNTQSRVSYRGPWMFETTARETMIDLAARAIGVDPLELRRRNVIQQSDLPYTMLRGTYESVTPAETLEQAITIIDYDGFRRQQSEARQAGRHLGIGISLFMEPTAGAIGTGISEAVTLRIDLSGTVQLVTGANSQGHSIETTMAQVVAEHLGVPIDDIVFTNGDTALVPLGASTGGSRNGVYGGGAARQAALELRQRVIDIAADLLEAAPEDLTIEDGRLSVLGAPSRTISMADVARVAYLEPSRIPGAVDSGLEVVARFTTGVANTWSNSAHVCTCEVDVETGFVKILRYVVSSDCGTMINPNVVEGQIAGGVVQGIGGALLEDFVYDADGNPLTTTFVDYLLPAATDVPVIEYGHIETPSGRPGGFKGMGEGGAIGAPAAVFNAVADALAPFGVSLTEMPLSPDAVLAAIVEASIR